MLKVTEISTTLAILNALHLLLPNAINKYLADNQLNTHYPLLSLPLKEALGKGCYRSFLLVRSSF